MILTADWHLDDKPENNYRWEVFRALEKLLATTEEKEIFVLGDLGDRKDRHSADLVNRVFDEFNGLLAHGADIHVIMGNHDAPLNGPAYWEILNNIQGKLNFYSEPAALGDLILLPYTPNPSSDWSDIDWDAYKAAFLHQPIAGGIYNGGKLEHGSAMPVFPRKLHAYAGDLHYPQVVKGVTYVGSPSRVRFGDNHSCRLLVLNSDYEIAEELVLDSPLKSIVTITDMSELKSLEWLPGDMLRVRFEFEPGRHEGFPVEVQRIREWADKEGVVLASVEGVVMQDKAVVEAPRFDADPVAVMAAFAKQEGLDEGLVEAGNWLLKQ